MLDDTPPRPLARRLILIVPALVLMVALVGLGLDVMRAAPRQGLDWALFAVFAVAMGWECLMVWQLTLGFVAWLRGPRALSAFEHRAALIEPLPTGRSRTAILVPIYDEDAASVFANVRVMARSLARLGPVGDVEIHVLSDSRDPAVAAAEVQEFSNLLHHWSTEPDGALPRVHYRRRSVNQGRKAGNIAEFLDRCGEAHDYMIVLDADSLMSGATMRRLIRLMEEHPRVGLIQTVSYATNRLTLFARIQQFAVRLYAPLALRGLEFWQGADGGYWGHNAILRVAAFREHCRLPVLPGRPPFGGEILCHDTVEGALMRRAGWENRLLVAMEGSWEEMPTNTVDLLGRERRWCQGNLQHLRVLALPGLTAGSWAHIGLGIAGYLLAPVWWAFLALAALRMLLGTEGEPMGVLAYGLTEAGRSAVLLFGLCAALIALPRVLNVVQALATGETRRGFGGAGRLVASATLEQGVWILLGPVLALTNAGFVLQTLLGRVVPWDAQPRADRPVGWPEALRIHLVAVLLGLVLAAAAWKAGGWAGLWLAPTALGLVVSPALTVWTSRTDLGHLANRLGLFLTVDETRPARELLELRGTARAEPVADVPATAEPEPTGP